eukprot:2913293-Prymnesium_polylepis.1
MKKPGKRTRKKQLASGLLGKRKSATHCAGAVGLTGEKLMSSRGADVAAPRPSIPFCAQFTHAQVTVRLSRLGTYSQKKLSDDAFHGISAARRRVCPPQPVVLRLTICTHAAGGCERFSPIVQARAGVSRTERRRCGRVRQVRWHRHHGSGAPRKGRLPNGGDRSFLVVSKPAHTWLASDRVTMTMRLPSNFAQHDGYTVSTHH